MTAIRRFSLAALTSLSLYCVFSLTAEAAPLPDSATTANTTSAEAIRAELTRKIPECDTVSENAARMLQQNASATTQVTEEWRNFCGKSREYYLYSLALRLNEITAASPEINTEMWETLKDWSKTKNGMRRHPEMTALLRKIASEANPPSEDGKLLKIWFVTGYTPFIRSVEKARDSRLYRFHRQDKAVFASGLSISTAINATYWVPTSNLATLGSHPGIGIQFHIGLENFFFGTVMDLRFADTPAPYNYYNENTAMLQQSTEFFGIYVGPDVKWAFLKFDQLSILAVAGFGYDIISHYSVPRYSRLRPTYSDSFNLNVGIGIRYYFNAGQNFYAESEFRIHRANFGTAGPGGADLSGAYFTAFLTLGFRLSFDD